MRSIVHSNQTLSNALERSKLMIQSGVFAARVFLQTQVGSQKMFFNSSFPARNHVALPVDLPPVRLPFVPTEVCKEFAQQTYVCNGPEIRHGFSCLCLRKHLEECPLPGGGTFPLLSTSLITSSKVFKKSSGECFKSSATSPRSSPLFLLFKRDIACFNSAIVHGGSVNVGIVMGEQGHHGTNAPTFWQSHRHEVDLQFHGQACGACPAASSTMKDCISMPTVSWISKCEVLVDGVFGCGRTVPSS